MQKIILVRTSESSLIKFHGVLMNMLKHKLKIPTHVPEEELNPTNLQREQ